MRKKSLLFVIDSLSIGGGEKSLVTLLRLLDYSNYDVDLQLFSIKGSFIRLLPEEVNILPPLAYTKFLQLPLWRQLFYPQKLLSRICYSIRLRCCGNLHVDKAQAYWKSISHQIDIYPKHYDIAIGYSQCIPTFYVSSKINANLKFGWVNCMLNLNEEQRKFQWTYYNKLNKICLVSPSSLELFTSVYPEFAHKMVLVKDICDADLIREMSLLPSPKLVDHSQLVIMTVGRLNKPQKGYDIALAAAKELRDRNLSFHWYAIGEGPYRAEMELYIAEHNLQDCFTLLGATPNPYAYMRQCDIYVQTSRFEGFGLTVAEARILNRPIVCTNFDACHMQLIDGKNALIASFEPTDIADKIELLMNDKSLYNSILQYQMAEKKGNVEDIEDFYELIK